LAPDHLPRNPSALDAAPDTAPTPVAPPFLTSRRSRRAETFLGKVPPPTNEATAPEHRHAQRPTHTRDLGILNAAQHPLDPHDDNCSRLGDLMNAVDLFAAERRTTPSGKATMVYLRDTTPSGKATMVYLRD
jgi:hypothetical protein